jgi:hypothetical protein
MNDSELIEFERIATVAFSGVASSDQSTAQTTLQAFSSSPGVIAQSKFVLTKSRNSWASLCVCKTLVQLFTKQWRALSSSERLANRLLCASSP